MPDRFLARLARGAGYVLTGNAPADWFGPQNPLPPQAPPAVAGRQFDYPFGFNLAATPRSWEPTGFAELRALADAFDLMRLVIETRKDQMERQTWRIRPRSLATNSVAAAADPRVAALTAFFLRPDRQHGWATWLRMLLEDLLVIDAPTLYKRRTRGGALWALELLDGATIKRLIDDWGLRLLAGRTGADERQYRVAPADLSASVLHRGQCSRGADRRARDLESRSDPAVPGLLGQPQFRRHRRAPPREIRARRGRQNLRSGARAGAEGRVRRMAGARRVLRLLGAPPPRSCRRSIARPRRMRRMWRSPKASRRCCTG